MPSQAPLQDRWHSVIKIVLIYAAFASAWILLSDKAVLLVTADPDEMVRISMFKGWAFVAVTSLLLYFLLNRYWGRYTAALTEQINALKLIETVADSSSDAIFAKDMDGRYLVFNQGQQLRRQTREGGDRPRRLGDFPQGAGGRTARHQSPGHRQGHHRNPF